MDKIGYRAVVRRLDHDQHLSRNNRNTPTVHAPVLRTRLSIQPDHLAVIQSATLDATQVRLPRIPLSSGYRAIP